MVAVESNFGSHERKLSLPAPTCIIVPPTTEPTFYKYYRGFDPVQAKNRIETNMELLDRIDSSLLNHDERLSFLQINSFLKRTWGRYKDKLTDIRQSFGMGFDIYPFLEDLHIPHMPDEIPVTSGCISLEKVPQFFSHYLDRAVGPTIVLSETHATTKALVQAIREKNPQARIGMFIFDTHTDTIMSAGGVTKSNVINHLIKPKRGQRLVEQIVVIGQPDDLYAVQIGQSNDPQNPRYQKRVRVISEEDLYDPYSDSLTFSDKQLQGIIEEHMARFARRDITNILISFDLDILQSGAIDYTGMEYNPFHALLYLSTLDLSRHHNDQSGMIHDLTHDDWLHTIFSRPTLLGGRGLSLRYIEQAMSLIHSCCLKHNIQYGIPVNRSLVLGDIVELEGPDYHNLTKQAAVSVMASMNQSVTERAARRN